MRGASGSVSCSKFQLRPPCPVSPTRLVGTGNLNGVQMQHPISAELGRENIVTGHVAYLHDSTAIYIPTEPHKQIYRYYISSHSYGCSALQNNFG